MLWDFIRIKRAYWDFQEKKMKVHTTNGLEFGFGVVCLQMEDQTEYTQMLVWRAYNTHIFGSLINFDTFNLENAA